MPGQRGAPGERGPQGGSGESGPPVYKFVSYNLKKNVSFWIFNTPISDKIAINLYKRQTILLFSFSIEVFSRRQGFLL